MYNYECINTCLCRYRITLVMYYLYPCFTVLPQGELHLSQGESHLLQGESRLLQEVSRTNELLQQLMGDLKRTMQRVGKLEDKVDSSSGRKSGMKNTTSRKKDVPLAVRVSSYCIMVYRGFIWHNYVHYYVLSISLYL